MNSLSDEELVRLAKEGQTEAFGYLYSRYRYRIFRLAKSRLQDDQLAKDATQETFLRALRGLKGFRGDSKFYGWVYVIAVNLCAGVTRKIRLEHKHCRPDPLYLKEEIEAAEFDIQKQKFISKIDDELDGLPRILREALILREIEGMSYKEMAHTLNISLNAVASRVHCARKRLREKFAPHFQEVVN